jgi:hypothetical protein
MAWEGDDPDCALAALDAVRCADETFGVGADKRANARGAMAVVARREGALAVARCDRRPRIIRAAAELGATTVPMYVMGVAVSSILVEKAVAASLSFRVERRNLFHTGHLE